jgi:hypothetical protein
LNLSTNHPIVKQAFTDGYDSYNPPAYRVTYYMTNREYTRAMNVIAMSWRPDNQRNYTHTKQNIIRSLVGLMSITRINP